MKEFWPIGTVVKIFDGEDAEFMIVGYLPRNEKGERRDYVSVRYPMGAFNNNTYFFFDHKHIKEVVFGGYHSEKFSAFLQIMNGLLLQEEQAKEEM